MAKTIIEMARAKVDAIRKDPEEAGQNATLAIAAINGGIRSAAWRSYMLQFVEQNPPGQPVDPAQLERLLGTDDTLGDPDLDRHRAYMVSNAVCGAGTETTNTITVATIDDTLPNVGPVIEQIEKAAARRKRYSKQNGRRPRGKK